MKYFLGTDLKMSEAAAVLGVGRCTVYRWEDNPPQWARAWAEEYALRRQLERELTEMQVAMIQVRRELTIRTAQLQYQD